jgi:hypothetical protein
MKHTCHAIACTTPCPPKMLMCRPCWALVTPATAREVYATVGKRGPRVDATWAPWWRAQAQATVENARARGVKFRSGKTIDDYLAHEMAFAAKLEVPRG